MMVDITAPVLDNHQVGPRLHLMTLSAPEIASSIKPGQFVHMQIPGMEGHILRRPFSVYAANVSEGTIEILYQVVGFGSERITKLAPGDEVAPKLIGPVGHSWAAPEKCERALLVGGGVGAAPLYLLFEQLVAAGVDVTVVLGAQTNATRVCFPPPAVVPRTRLCAPPTTARLGVRAFAPRLSMTRSARQTRVGSPSITWLFAVLSRS